MAVSSGWQGKKYYHASGNVGVVDWYGDIYISSITHSGTNLRVVGKFGVAAVGTAGASAYYNYGMRGSMATNDGTKVGSTQTLLKGYERLYTGSAVEKDFDITISDVPASATSYNLGCRMWACYNETCTQTFWDVTKYWPIEFNPSTAPSGLYINNISTAYNSVSATVGLGSWGSSSGTNTLEMLVLTQQYVAGLPHRYSQTTSGALSFSTTVSNSSSCSGAGCITIKGAGTYYTGVYTKNGAGVESRLAGPAVYTPPAPMTSLTYTQTQQATNVKINVFTVGGSSSDNNSNSVTTYMRYSTNGGGSYSSWTPIGSGNAWDTYTGNFTCAYGANVIIQTKQNYGGAGGADSAVKSVSFTATSGTAPSGGSLTVTGSTWNTVTLQASGVSYGMPSSVTGRKISVGVSGSSSNLNYKRENQYENVTGATATITNSSIYPGASALTLKGMLAVYPYLWAWNTVQSNTVVHHTNAYYLPPAPGQLSYTTDALRTYTINYSGVAANNVTDYTPGDLTRTVRYKIGASGNWTYIENASVVALTTVTTQQITVPFDEDVYAEAWLTYKGKNSDVSSFMIPGQPRPVIFYGSANDKAELIEHLYGSVNGEAKKITKLYGSVGGVAREVFVDV